MIGTPLVTLTTLYVYIYIMGNYYYPICILARVASILEFMKSARPF